MPFSANNSTFALPHRGRAEKPKLDMVLHFSQMRRALLVLKISPAISLLRTGLKDPNGANAKRFLWPNLNVN